MALGRHASEIIDSWHLLSTEAKNSALGPTTGIQELEKHAILDEEVFKCRIHLSVPTSSCFQISRDYFFPPNMQYLLALAWFAEGLMAKTKQNRTNKTQIHERKKPLIASSIHYRINEYQWTVLIGILWVHEFIYVAKSHLNKTWNLNLHFFLLLLLSIFETLASQGPQSKMYELNSNVCIWELLSNIINFNLSVILSCAPNDRYKVHQIIPLEKNFFYILLPS